MGTLYDVLRNSGVEVDTTPKGEFSLSNLLPEEERGFIGNIIESWKRGRETIAADIAVYEAATGGGNIEDALRYRKKLQNKEAIDPVAGNFLQGLVYKTTRILPAWLESAKQGIIPAAKGAAIGAGVAATVGSALPLPEEAVTVPALAAKGAKWGFTVGNAHFWYKQGAGSMYADMLDSGYDPKKSLRVAQIAAVPYALIEFMQIKGLTPAIKKTLQPVLNKTAGRIMAKFGKKYLTTLGKEVGEEVLQEAVQIAATDIAGVLSGADIEFDKKYFMEQAKRLGKVTWEATQAMALLPVPSAVVGAMAETAKETATAKIAEEKKYSDVGLYYPPDPVGAEASKGFGFDENSTLLAQDGSVSEIYSSNEAKALMGRIPTDPLGKLQISLISAASQYKDIIAKRKPELTEKFGLAEDKLYSSPTALEGFKKARGAMKGKLSDIQIQPQESIMSPADWESLFQEIRDTEKLSTPEKLNLYDSIDKLAKEGRIPRPYEMGLFAKQFGPLIAQTMETFGEIEKSTKPLSKWDLFMDVIGFPKAVSASMDLSRTLRQNILLIGNPKAWYKGLETDWKLMLSDESVARQLEMEALTGPYSHLARRTTLRINKWGESGKYATRAEAFPSKIAHKIPLVERSERAYTAGGNLVRTYLFDQVAEEWENRDGFKPTDKDYQDLAHVINVLTGEGDPKLMGDFAPFLNATFFAPRLLAGRFQSIFEIFNPHKSIAARKILAQHVLKAAIINMLILKLFANVKGVSVERDPRSTEFGKLKFGNTRIDFWGGYQPIVRLAAELLSGQHKTQTGEIIDKSRKEAVITFLQSKLGPVPAATLDFMRGETFYGEERKYSDPDDLAQTFYEKLTPFFIQDIIDAARFNGVGTAAIIAPLAFHGVGTQSYEQTAGTKLTLQKNRIAQSVFGKNWKDVGPEAQKALREHWREIEEEEKKLDYEYQSPKYMERLAKQQAESEKRIMKGLSPSVQKELSEYKISIGGVGRRIGADWYLNDKRYDIYEKTTTKALNRVLPAIFKAKWWAGIPFMDRQTIIADITGRVKKAVRTKIISEANVTDVKYLLEKD